MKSVESYPSTARAAIRQRSGVAELSVAVTASSAWSSECPRHPDTQGVPRLRLEASREYPRPSPYTRKSPTRSSPRRARIRLDSAMPPVRKIRMPCSTVMSG